MARNEHGAQQPAFDPAEYERTSQQESAPGETGQLEQEPPQPPPSSQPKPPVPMPDIAEGEHGSQEERAVQGTRERE